MCVELNMIKIGNPKDTLMYLPVGYISLILYTGIIERSSVFF